MAASHKFRLAALETRSAPSRRGAIPIATVDDAGAFWSDGKRLEDVAPLITVLPGMLETLCSVGGEP